MGFMRTALVLAATLVAIPAWAAPNAVLTASRTSGIAPLYVMFDAQKTTHSSSSVHPFHSLAYHFEFGEKRRDASYSATWGDSTGTDFHRHFSKDEYHGGPLAGHVYEKPGTYTATVTVEDGQGGSDTSSVTITVHDPNDSSRGFGGSNTICVRATSSGGFSDPQNACQGAAQITNSDVGSILGMATSGKRVLLRRGDVFNGAGKVSGSQITVGAFGSGPKPRLQTGASPGDVLLRVVGTDIRFHDLDLEFTNAPSEGWNVHCDWDTKQLLFLRMEATGGARAFVCAYHGGNPEKRHEELAIVDSLYRGYSGGYLSGQNGANLSFDKYGFLAGNTFGEGGEHNTRIFFIQDSVVSFNYSDRAPSPNKAVMVVMATDDQYRGTDPNTGKRRTLHSTPRINSERFILSYNTCSSAIPYGLTCMTGFGARADNASGILQDGMIEGNFLPHGNRIAASGERVTIRNNIQRIDLRDPIQTLTRGKTASDCNTYNGQTVCGQHVNRDHWVYNNTCYQSGTQDECIVFGGGGEQVAVANLLWAPAASNAVIAKGANQTQNNVVLDSGASSPFVTSNPNLYSDFRLKSLSGVGPDPDFIGNAMATVVAGGGSTSGGSTGGTSGGSTGGSTGGDTSGGSTGGDTSGGSTGGNTGGSTDGGSVVDGGDEEPAPGPPQRPILLEP